MRTRLKDDSMERNKYTDSNIKYEHVEKMSNSSFPGSSIELLYIWINEDETGFIQQQGFNFSPNYKFEMIGCEDGGYKLSCAINPDYPNVWKTGNIVGLTAIVGENGSGKTSLLRHLGNVSVLSDAKSKTEDYPSTKVVYIYRQNESVYILHNFPEDKLKNLTSYKIMYISGRDSHQAKTLLDNQTRIYMTNAFSTSRSLWRSSDPPQYISFSPTTNDERSRDFFYKISGQIMADNLPHDFLSMQKRIVSYKTSEEFEQLLAISYYSQLLSEQRAHTALWAANTEIIVGVGNPARWFQVKCEKTDYRPASDGQCRTALANLLKDYADPSKNLSLAHSRDIIEVLQDALLLELASLLDNGYAVPSTCALFRKDLFEWIKLYTCAVPDYHDCIRAYYEAAINEIAELKDILSGCPELPGHSIYPHKSASQCATIKRDSNSYVRFCAFVDRLMRQETSFVLKHVIVDMPPLSSGERAFQNILSWLRLPPSFEEILGRNSIPIQDNVLLLLDEVDLHMHPEWQRVFLKGLSDRLAVEYPDKRIQVILSTHSPLILSDIPTGNIIYLEKHDEKCTIAYGPEKKESFGANIFSLLKDSFYLKKSLGEFAYFKITAVIDDLNELKKSPDNDALREKCRGHNRLINIIGEPMIRKKLKLLYAELFDGNSDDPYKRDLERLSKLCESSNPEERSKYQKMLQKILSDGKVD